MNVTIIVRFVPAGGLGLSCGKVMAHQPAIFWPTSSSHVFLTVEMSELGVIVRVFRMGGWIIAVISERAS